MLARMCELLGGITGNVSVVAPPGRYEKIGVPIVPDRWPGAGPLGGIATALLHTAAVGNCAWNLIVGCDQPFLTTEWLEYLVERTAMSRVQAIIPRSETGFEPLCACYRTDAGPALAAALERGERKVMRGMEGIGVEVLDAADWKRFDSAGRLFWNMNTPADYDNVRAAWGSG